MTLSKHILIDQRVAWREVMLLQDHLSKRYATVTLSDICQANKVRSMILPRSPQDTPSISFSTAQRSFILRELNLDDMRALFSTSFP
jgi:hypothetical protein